MEAVKYTIPNIRLLKNCLHIVTFMKFEAFLSLKESMKDERNVAQVREEK